jgi:ferritin-like metal-binding protein YciE
MPAHSLQELLVEELRDIYDGEKRLTKALPQMARAASSEQLRTAFMNHLRETERHVTRLEQVFRTMGETARGKTCDGIIGIVEEGKKAMEQFDGAVLDAALIAGGQKVEHYEIATYGTLAYFAKLLGNERAKELLGETLDEEKAADERLTTIAKSDVNQQALMGDGEEEEDAGTGSAFGRLRRTMESLTTANEETPQRRSSGTGRRRGTTSRKAKRTAGTRRSRR